uniref:histidine kinase n=1 Tax=Candidatus Kentrum eta TaxID=2126337 RepID=A0A450VI48_9GAMM|nr:MAG: Signal transduction histidine kinase [Candidatus Kentron sp. H]VFK00438.1 MAG: Signal transduction histidine kinase [Candidatus Kentron sp. H]VFK04484.1 MAG: Signal transduction histidine kinase [Candidatus Kentron sp. H]
MRLRSQIFLILLLFGLAPLVAAVIINLPVILDRLNHLESVYHDAYRKFLHGEFHDLNQHLFSRNEMVRLLAKVPEPGFLLKRDYHPGESPDVPGRFPAAPIVAQPAPYVGSRSLPIARMRYTNWINQMLRDQRDIVQILFLDKKEKEQFWLERNPKTLMFDSTGQPKDRPTPAFLKAAVHLNPGGFLVSKINVNPEATDTDPRYVMVLRLISPIVGYGRPGNESRLGAVVISIDVGQLSKSFRDTYWVHSDGHYLSVADGTAGSRTAFDDFPGLEGIFENMPDDRSGKPTPEIWKGKDGKRVIWIPWFLTEQSGILWIGRQVDSSPVTDILRALPLRVIAIVLSLIVAVLIVAHWFAGRAERFRRELTDGIRRVVAYNEPVRFSWRGPQELREFGKNLTRLTDRHAQHTEALRAHSRELEESNRYKSEFLANVSHELRTPLNSIILLSKILAENADNQLSADHCKQSRVIYTAAQDLRALIDDILDLSRIDAKQITLTPEPIDLPKLLAGLVELVEPQIEEKGLDVCIVFEEDVPGNLVSDEEKVRQILKNFLSNAIKFTREGEITLRVTRNTDHDQSQRPIRISVRDAGIGIPSEKQEVIFEAFQQADGSTNRRYGGTGLGLTISRKLAELLGGRIHLTSEVGKGSTFSLLLPETQRDEAEARSGIVVQSIPQSDNSSGHSDDDSSDDHSSTEHSARDETEMHEGFRGKSILIVDNDIHALLALAPELERWGLVVAAAFDAEEALETLSEDGLFDLILINLDLPEKDGYEAIFRIRGRESSQNIPIVALATEYDRENQERCLATGAVECLSKPVEPLQLKRSLARYVAKPS